MSFILRLISIIVTAVDMQLIGNTTVIFFNNTVEIQVLDYYWIKVKFGAPD